jgi:hypothetical protein
MPRFASAIRWSACSRIKNTHTTITLENRNLVDRKGFEYQDPRIASYSTVHSSLTTLYLRFRFAVKSVLVTKVAAQSASHKFRHLLWPCAMCIKGTRTSSNPHSFTEIFNAFLCPYNLNLQVNVLLGGGRNRVDLGYSLQKFKNVDHRSRISLEPKS